MFDKFSHRLRNLLFDQRLTQNSGTKIKLLYVYQRRGAVVQWLARSLITRTARIRFPDQAASIIRCKNLALYIRDCESLCLSDETVKAVGPFYLVSMLGEVKDPTQGVNV